MIYAEAERNDVDAIIRAARLRREASRLRREAAEARERLQLQRGSMKRAGSAVRDVLHLRVDEDDSGSR
jgi:hypothetical protein